MLLHLCDRNNPPLIRIHLMIMGYFAECTMSRQYYDLCVTSDDDIQHD